MSGSRKGLSLAAKWVRRQGVMFAVAVLSLATAASAFATEPPLALPDTGVDVPGLIELAITAMGGIAAVAVGGFIAFLVVRKALSWVRRAI